MKTGPRAVAMAPLAAVPCSVKAVQATCGAAPSPGTGSSRWKKPGLLNHELELPRDRLEIRDVLDAARELRRLIGDALVGSLQ